MIECVKTEHKCPECNSNLEFDVSAGDEILETGGFINDILVNIYCSNDNCDYYSWVYFDPITKEIE